MNRCLATNSDEYQIVKIYSTNGDQKGLFPNSTVISDWVPKSNVKVKTVDTYQCTSSLTNSAFGLQPSFFLVQPIVTFQKIISYVLTTLHGFWVLMVLCSSIGWFLRSVTMIIHFALWWSFMQHSSSLYASTSGLWKVVSVARLSQKKFDTQKVMSTLNV